MKKLSLTQIDIKYAKIRSWLPTIESDKYYPIKEVIVITTDANGTVDRGYIPTTIKMTREEITEYNLETHGVTDEDRETVMSMSMRSKRRRRGLYLSKRPL